MSASSSSSSAPTPSPSASDLVIISYSDLLTPSVDISPSLHRAFGPGSLGVIGVRGIPDWERVWKQSVAQHHALVKQPEEVLKGLEDEKSMFNAGWSFGKEKLGDVPDLFKSSYYFNPLSDNPRPDMSEKFPWFYPQNRWPSKDKLPHFQQYAVQLGQLMYEVILSLAVHIDKLGFDPLADSIRKGKKAKARALYYFPLPEEEAKKAANKPDGWIGWHNDSGFLTGLTPDIYLNHATGEVLPSNPEPDTAGLWVAARDGSSIRVNIPHDVMAIQCGECLQVASCGAFVATPHCVKPPVRSPGVARACMPLFVDTEPDYALVAPDSKGGREAVLRDTVKQWVPPLADRWTNGQTFADFLGTSFRAYYAWTVKNQQADKK